MKNITKKILLVLISAITLLTAINTNAVAKTIELGGTETIEAYIGETKFTTKTIKNGGLAYCLNMSKKTAKNITANLVKEEDAGVAYILVNGYPSKSITGDKFKDYYITQTALWWYLDDTTGSTNLSEKFKVSGTDKYNLRPTIKNLVAKAKEAKSAGYVKTTLSISTSSNSMTLTDGYYVSQAISAKSSNISSYKVALTNAPSGTVIVDNKGATKTTFASNETFKVKVPAKAVTETSMNITITASATGTTYKAYRYEPTNKDMQPITPATPEKETTDVTSKLTLNIESSKVKIVKIDANTSKAIAGASLVMKDSSGKVITSWTSTTNYHVIRNLKNGTYTITETEAPTGYLLNEEPITFTITDTNKEIEIKIENTPRLSVVNILKVDNETGEPLTGAELVVKDSAGVEIARFTSTEEPFVLTDLEDGTYTVEEISAPTGYMLSEEKISFTIDSKNLSHQIMFGNNKEVIVPNTNATSSIIITLIGIAIIAFGIKIVMKDEKKSNR